MYHFCSWASPSQRIAVLATLPLIVCGVWDDSNFLDWFADSLNTTVDHPLVFDGKVPSYLTGTFVQTGPARFSFGNMKFTHMLDGYSKTNTLRFGKDGKAYYTSEFLASAFMNDSIKDNGIARGMFVGGIEPPPHWGPTGVLGPNDNNYIKVRKIGKQRMILADTMVATETQSDCTTFDSNIRPKMLALVVPGVSWDDNIEVLGDLCMLGTMAHAAEDPATGVFTGAMGCLGLSGNYHIVFNIDPSAPTVRKLVAKILLPHGRGPSYMHALGATPNYIVLIAEPLHMDLVNVMRGDPLGKGGLLTTNDTTLFHVVHRKSGSVRTLEAPGFIFGHVLNSWEEDGDILLDLTWYEAGNATTLGWMNRWFLEYITDEPTREAWPRAQVVRYRLKADGKVEKTNLFAEEKGEDDFEVPKINEKLQGHPYCITYMMQFHSYKYNVDQNAKKGGPMGAVGLAKRNLCTGERMGWYEPNSYPSEVQFVANPAGDAGEDDGVLLGIVFDGSSKTSYFQILDARTMKRIAKAPLPIKSPFLIHSSYFPEEASALEILV